MVGLRDVARAYPEVRFFGISRDRPSESLEMEKKIAKDGRGPLGFPLLSDLHGTIINRYHLRDPAFSSGVPKPAVYVLDKDGKIRWAKIEDDYRERPSSEDVAAAIDAFD